MELEDLLVETRRVIAAAQALELRLVQELIRRGIPEAQGAPDPRAYLMARLNMSPAAAGRTLRMAAALSGSMAATGTAFSEGVICLERAAAIVAGVAVHASADEQRQVEDFLLDQANSLTAAQLRRLDKALDAVFDPDGPAPREEAAKAKRAAHISDNHDGTQTLTWRDTDEVMAKVKAALDPLSAPRPGRHSMPGTSSGRCLVGPDRSDPTVRQRAEFTRLPDSVAGDHRLAGSARRNGIRLDGDGVPLAVGRTRRTVTSGIWKALAVRDGGCVFPDCTRPAAWTQAHHIVPWSEGGPTELSNLALACDPHHDAIHHDGWQIRMGARGQPELVPPRWVDPEQRPRRNEYWRIQRRGLTTA